MAGGNSGGVESYLPIAAALAATIATDGAASPWLVDAMGATAAGALTSGAAAAAASGLTAAVTGQDVGRSALTGAVTGGIGGGISGYNAAAGTTTAAPLTGSNVAGSAAIPSGGGAFIPTAGSGASFSIPSGAAFTPATGPVLVDAVSGPISGVGASGAGPTLPSPAVTPPGTPPGTPPAVAPGGIGSTISKMAPYALGATALGALIQADNRKYGTPATETYDGPLSDFSYDRKKYTPLEATPPNPPYRAQYANYVRTPYNAYAAKGGKVVAMADGGIAMANPSIGPVEQMSRANAMGNNQMFPQAGINSPSFASATNTPMTQNIVSGVSDAAVDPYTGMQRFAEGGTAEAPAAIPLQAMPNLITQNAVSNNNALTQDLVSRMAARNAMNPAPDQVAPVAPAGIMAAAPYTAPTFTRPTVAPIEFQNPKAIVGTKAYNDEQARLAAEEAARQAAMAAAANPPEPYYVNYGGAAAGGLMRAYSGGGKAASSNMAAIDDYMAQYQSDPASVTAKAKSGDWNAMIALNKIKGTPNQNYAAGGHLGGYSDGGRMLKGPGDGMSDNIPATIGGKQPARLADGEFVVPADVVSHLGNGSTDAGAKHLYAMMDRVRKARTGTKKQGKQIKPAKYLKA